MQSPDTRPTTNNATVRLERFKPQNKDQFKANETGIGLRASLRYKGRGKEPRAYVNLHAMEPADYAIIPFLA